MTAGQTDTVTQERSLPGMVLEPDARVLDGVFITPDTAKQLGITPVDGLILINYAATPTAQTLDAVNAGLEAVLPNATPIDTIRDPEADRQAANWLTLSLVVLIVLAASATALGLSRIEGRKDQRTLDAIGAPRRVLRQINAIQAATISLTAISIGTASALIPVYCIFGITDVPFAPPWAQILLLLCVTPVTLAAAAYVVGQRNLGPRALA